MQLDTDKLSRLVGDLEVHIRAQNTHLALSTLILLRQSLGDRIAQDSMDANLKAYEEAQARASQPPAKPAAIGGFESIDPHSPIVIKKKRNRKSKIDVVEEN